MAKLNVFQYVRVSSDTQDKRLTWKSQIKANDRLCDDQKFKVLEIFRDIGSGFDDIEEHEALMEMLTRLNEVHAVVTFDMDRFSRTDIGTALIMNAFRKNDTLIYFVEAKGSKIIDPSSDIDSFVAEIIAAASRLEARKTKKRQIAGIQRRIEETGTWGRPAINIPLSKFRAFLDEKTDPPTLIVPKNSLCEYFKVGKSAFYRWLREHGFGYMIGEEPKSLREGKAKRLKKLVEGEV